MIETKRLENPRICQWGPHFERMCAEAVRMARIAHAIEAEIKKGVGQ